MMVPIMPSVPISYTLKIRKNVRRLRLSVDRHGEVTVTAPKSASVKKVDAFVSSQAEWIRQAQAKFSALPAPIVPKGNAGDFKIYKKQALQLAKDRLAHFNSLPFYNFTIGKVSIRNQKSRWGSCSKSGNLSFSYRIALLPPEFADYVIVHELCHIGRFDHSKAFWALVAKAVPDWKELRKKMR